MSEVREENSADAGEQIDPTNKLVIGIDLGTTKSAVSVWDEGAGRAVILDSLDGGESTPSVVAWERQRGEWLVGAAARALLEEYPSDVVYSIKRFIGRWFNEREVQIRISDMTYSLRSGGGTDALRDVLVNFGGQPPDQNAPQISARVLAKLRADAAAALGRPIEEIRHAVVTVPAYFNVLQKHATVEAGHAAGLEAVYILDEPTAAALAYHQTMPVGVEQHILVYDLGGGTFDVSLLDASRDDIGYAFFTKVVDGDTYLGGDDIDKEIVKWLAKQIEQQSGQKIRDDDTLTRSRLRLAAERAKVELSNAQSTTVDLHGLTLSGGESLDARVELTVEQLHECAAPVIEKTLKIASRAVREVAGLEWDQIDSVILVGGQTLMPAVRQAVARETGRAPLVLPRPQLAVALGAGEYAHILSLGKERFHANTLVNVLALPLGVWVNENDFKPIVNANVKLPYRSSPYDVTPFEKDQTKIKVRVLQGERGVKHADECVELGSVEMNVIGAGGGTPKFSIELDVQANGTMTVIVTDRATGRPQRRDITRPAVALSGKESAAQDQAPRAPQDQAPGA
jgi:molecular chaperone DnaK